MHFFLFFHFPREFPQNQMGEVFLTVYMWKHTCVCKRFPNPTGKSSLEWAGTAIMYNFPFSCATWTFPRPGVCVCARACYLFIHSTNIYRVRVICRRWTRYRVWWWENRDSNLLDSAILMREAIAKTCSLLQKLINVMERKIKHVGVGERVSQVGSQGRFPVDVILRKGLHELQKDISR